MADENDHSGARGKPGVRARMEAAWAGTGGVTCLSFSPFFQKYFLAGCGDGSVRLYKVCLAVPGGGDAEGGGGAGGGMGARRELSYIWGVLRRKAIYH